jgi:hypothetical protein
MKTKTFYAAFTNTDCTEGRGQQIAFAISECESTVERVGKKGYIMGSDCPISEVQVIDVDGRWYVPLHSVPLKFPTAEDMKQEAARIARKELKRKKDEAIERAKSLGMSDEDIALLKNSV